MVGPKIPPVAASLLLAGVAVAWGAIPLFVRNDVPSAGLVGVRVTFGALALVLAAASVRRLGFPSVHRWRVTISGVLLAAHWLTFFGSLKLTTVAIALSLLYLGPIAAALLSGPLLGETVTPRLWLALGIAASGTVLVVQPWDFGDDGGSLAGMGLALLSGALLTALMINAKPAAEALGGLTLSLGELTVAAVVLAPATTNALANYGDEIVNFLILGAVFTGFAGFVYWEVYRALPVAAVSTVMYIEPASAVVWAMLFLDETPTLMTWVGVSLVVVGGALAATVGGAKEELVVPAAL